jgi:hypothetical protein
MTERHFMTGFTATGTTTITAILCDTPHNIYEQRSMKHRNRQQDTRACHSDKSMRGRWMAATIIALLLSASTAGAQWSNDPSANNLVDLNGTVSRIVAVGTGGTVAVWIAPNSTISAARYDASGDPAAYWGIASVTIPGNLNLKFLEIAPGTTPDPALGMNPGLPSGVVHIVVGAATGEVYTVTLDNNGLFDTPFLLSGNGDPGNGLAIAEGGVVWAGGPAHGNKIVTRTSAGAIAPVSIAPDPASVQKNCHVVPDGYGGVIVIWEDYRGSSAPRIHAQRLVNGAKMWSEDGYDILMTTTPVATGRQTNPQMVFVPGRVYQSGPGGTHGYTYTSAGGHVCIAWEDTRNGSTAGRDIYIQSLDVWGNRLWNPIGTPVSTADGDQQAIAMTISDDAAAVVGSNLYPGVYRDIFIAWQDRRDGIWKRYAQRISRDGDLRWSPDPFADVPDMNGMLVSHRPGATGVLEPLPPTIVTANNEAVITSVSYPGGSYIDASLPDIHAQRLSSEGVVVWSQPLSIATGDQLPVYSALIPQSEWSTDDLIVSLWIDTRSPSTPAVYAQAMRWCDGAVDLMLPTGGDVWIRRSGIDDGSDPLPYNTTDWTDAPWNAPDVWNVTTDGSGTPIDPDDPMGMLHSDPNLLYSNIRRVRLRNRGCTPSDQGELGAWLSPPSTGDPWPSGPSSAWTLQGGIQGVPSIPPGGEVIIDIPWTPLVTGHKCFYIRFESNNDPIQSEGAWPINNVVASNNLAHRNIDIIDYATRSTEHFFINNFDNRFRDIDLHFDLNRLTPGPTRLNNLGVSLRLDPEMYSAWDKAGRRGEGIRVNRDSSIQLVDTAHARMLGLSMGPRGRARVEYRFDSLDKNTVEHLGIQVSQYTLDSGARRLDGGLTWDIRVGRSTVTPPPTGGDTLGPDRLTPRPIHVQTFALYVANQNRPGTTITSVVIGTGPNTTILAVGPPEDPRKTTISLAKDRTGHRYVYRCATEDQTRIYPGQSFRPIYLTVSSADTGSISLTFQTIDQRGDTISNGSVTVRDPLTSGIRDENHPALVMRSSILECYPNPATSTGTVRFALPSIVHGADLVLSDAAGRRIRTLVERGTFASGVNEREFDLSDLPSGVYFVTLEIDGSSYTASIRVLH